jgi:two-component system, OmpR family, response regulator
MRILVADDDLETQRLVVRVLREDGHDLKAVGSCAGVNVAVSTAAFDVVVLDVMLPDGSGIELCARLRAVQNQVPILLLTARGEVRDRVTGLEAGADDYLPKPFAVAELRARVKALGRRGPVLRARVVTIDALQIDFEARRVRLNGVALALTARELAIIELLAGRHGHIVARDQLIESLWGDAKESVRASVDVLVARIRRKLGVHATLLRTVRGAGYILGEAE